MPAGSSKVQSSSAPQEPVPRPKFTVALSRLHCYSAETRQMFFGGAPPQRPEAKNPAKGGKFRSHSPCKSVRFSQKLNVCYLKGTKPARSVYGYRYPLALSPRVIAQ
jgi:hypothetical protein